MPNFEIIVFFLKKVYLSTGAEVENQNIVKT